MRPVRLVQTIIVLAVSMFLKYAKADTIYVSDFPGSKITSKEALKAQDGVWECVKVKAHATQAKATKLKGAKVSYHPLSSLDVNKGLEDASAQLGDGKTLVECKSKEPSSGKLKALAL